MITQQVPRLRWHAPCTTVLGLGADPDCARPSLAAVQVTLNGTRQKDVHLLGLAMLVAKGGPPEIAKVWPRFSEDALKTLVLSSAWDFPHQWSLAVEGQKVYLGKSKSVPKDLLKVAWVTGILLTTPFLGITLPPPLPSEWKGEVPKETHQGRVLLRLGHRAKVMGGKREEDRYCVPLPGGQLDPWLERFNDSDWKHLCDSIGLAIWAAETTFP